MGIYFSASSRGFYDTAIHANLFVEHVETDPNTGATLDRYLAPDPSGPIADAVAITDDEHRGLLAAQALGKTIAADATGAPVTVDPPAPSTAQLAESARTGRDRLLRECDWTALPDVPMDAYMRAAWSAYRQALRDVTAQPGFPAAITWPTPPGDPTP